MRLAPQFMRWINGEVYFDTRGLSRDPEDIKRVEDRLAEDRKKASIVKRWEQNKSFIKEANTDLKALAWTSWLKENER